MKVYCILSDERVFQAKSTRIFSTVLQRQGIKASYVPFKVKPGDLGQALNSLRILNIAGANVTVPYKEAVIPFLDILSEGANVIGAINTIVCDGDKLKGYNTNAIGVMDALSSVDFAVDGKRALVFGTGGAARAVVFILNWLRTENVYITGRDPAKVNGLVDTFGGEALNVSDLPETRLPVDLIINATSVSSMEEGPELADVAGRLDVPDCRLILDLNYGRRENFWEKMALARDIRFIDGLPPLAYQARRTFALWTGMQVPPEEFLEALKNGA